MGSYYMYIQYPWSEVFVNSAFYNGVGISEKNELKYKWIKMK